MLIADEDGNCTSSSRVGGQSNGVVEEVSQGSQDIVATDVTAFQDYGDGDAWRDAKVCVSECERGCAIIL